MDGLSGAASGMAVVSLALQLSDGIKQLYDFWGSVKDAPDEIRVITTDLGLLSSVLAEMASEEQHYGPDPTLKAALELCCDRVSKIANLTNEMEPGFASMSFRIRKWTAFKAVLKGEKIQKLQKVLEGLKSTLMLAQQNYHSRLNRIRYQSHQQDLTTITRQLSSLRIEQMSATITTLSNSSSVDSDHTDVLRGEASQICQTIQNPVQRVGFELGSELAVQDLVSNLSRDRRTIPWPPSNPQVDRSSLTCSEERPHRSGRQQKWTKRTLSVGNSITKTIFGAISTTTTTRFLRSNLVDDDALDDEKYQYEHETSFSILPAQWLLKLGFNYAYSFSTYDSSTQGWRFSLKPINLVPKDSPIFGLCWQGNIGKVRELISKNLASARDVNSDGCTPLHFAAQSHSPELCKFLIQAGADKTARTFGYRWSPLQWLSFGKITEDRSANAIDTCRIFEELFDFWDEDGEGWHVLKYVFENSGVFSTDYQGTLTFLLWLIQSSSPDIKANYDTGKVNEFITWANDKVIDAVSLLLKLGPPGTIDNPDLLHTVHSNIIFRNCNKVKTLLALGANPHLILNDYQNSPRAESPLSLAMYSSWAFSSFRDALYGIHFDVEDFARQELQQGCPLLDAGWQIETLSALLKLDIEPDVELLRDWGGWITCDSCRFEVRSVEVQPYWQGVLESIKNGMLPQKFHSDSHDEKPSSSDCDLAVHNKDPPTNAEDGSALSYDSALPEDQAAQPDEDSLASEDGTSSIIPDRKEVWCTDCWYYFKETGRRHPPAVTETDSSDGDDSSEEDFSPFLFNT